MFCIPLGLKHCASKAAKGSGCLLTGGAIARGISLLPEAALIPARGGGGQGATDPGWALALGLLSGSPAAARGDTQEQVAWEEEPSRDLPKIATWRQQDRAGRLRCRTIFKGPPDTGEVGKWKQGNSTQHLTQK